MVEFYIHAFLVSLKQHSKMLLYGLKNGHNLSL